MESAGKITVVGTGPGDTALVTPAARRAAGEAGCLVGGRGAFAVLPPGDRPHHVIDRDLGAALDYIDRMRERGLKVCVLMTGDPCLYSFLPRITGRFGKEAVEVIPGISSLQAALARFGLSLESVQVGSLHGRDLDSLARLDFSRPVAVLTDAATASLAAAKLLPFTGDRRVQLGIELTLPGERTMDLTLAELAAGRMSAGPAVMVVHPGGSAPGRFPPDSAFQRGDVPMTREEVRFLAVALADPPPAAVVWDVGCGTGSMSCQLARFVPSGRVYAIDRAGEASALTRQNARKLGLMNVEVVEGEAPGAFDSLPDPDIVFLGGSSGDKKGIIGAAAGRLKAGGLLLAAAVTLETLEAAREALCFDPQFKVDVRMVSVARLGSLGRYSSFDGGRPVFMIRARRSG